MAKKGIIFSDIDGTLIFQREGHNIQKLENKKNGLTKILDPYNGKKYFAYDVSTNLYSVFLDQNTRKLAQNVSKNYHFVLVSGARKTTMDERKDIMDFADDYILENGGLILNKDYTIDSEWSKKLDPEGPYLEIIKQELLDQNWNLDIKGRINAIRVRKKDNKNKLDSEFRYLCENIELPSQLRKTMNIGNLDIILASAGKGRGVDYLTSKMGYKKSQTIGIGDDINDIEMLESTEKKYVLGSSYSSVLDIAKNKGWYISKGSHFEGINEILEKINSES